MWILYGSLLNCKAINKRVLSSSENVLLTSAQHIFNEHILKYLQSEYKWQFFPESKYNRA